MTHRSMPIRRAAVSAIQSLIRFRLPGDLEDRVMLQILVRLKAMALELFLGRDYLDVCRRMNFPGSVRPEQILRRQPGAAVGKDDNMIVSFEIVRQIVHPAALRRENGSMLLMFIVEIHDDV